MNNHPKNQIPGDHHEDQDCRREPRRRGPDPPTQPDNSGVGVNYADAFIKPMNIELENGMKLTCKRKGLKIMLSLDDKKGEALLRKREFGPDITTILNQALTEAAQAIGTAYSMEDGALFIEV